MTINHGKVTFYTKIAYPFPQIIFLVSIVYSPRDKCFAAYFFDACIGHFSKVREEKIRSVVPIAGTTHLVALVLFLKSSGILLRLCIFHKQLKLTS